MVESVGEDTLTEGRGRREEGGEGKGGGGGGGEGLVRSLTGWVGTKQKGGDLFVLKEKNCEEMFAHSKHNTNSQKNKKKNFFFFGFLCFFCFFLFFFVIFCFRF